MGGRHWPVRLLLPGVMLALGCNAIQEQLPTQPTASPSPSPSSLTPIAIPVILPKAAPTPTPAPKPSPTAAPSPAPTPSTPPSTGSCDLPPSNPPNPTCTDDGPLLYGPVDIALTLTTQTRPGLFDMTDKKCDNCYRVLNVSGYVAEVQKQLSAQGICSLWDGEELAVKKSNQYSEQYDILLASGHMRRGVGSFRGVCRPSWF